MGEVSTLIGTAMALLRTGGPGSGSTPGAGSSASAARP
jgi:hypothetical protein